MKCRTGEDDEDSLLFEHVELSDVRTRDNLDGNLVAFSKVGEVDSIVGTEDHSISVVCNIRSASSCSREDERLTERSSAGDSIRANEITFAQRQRIENQTSLPQFVLSPLNLLQPLLPPSPRCRPERDLVSSSSEMDESHGESLLAVLVDSRGWI